jgi:RNA polymerase sigma-70 factor (ECF subfamily)
MTPKEERKLIKRLKAREERAFREFVQLHQHRVFNLVYRMLGDRAEAEDLSQEVFVTVFKAIGRFRGESRLSTWLYRIAANHAKNRLKYLARRRRGMKDSLEDVPEGELHRSSDRHAPRPDRLAIGHQLEALIQQALIELNEEHRLVIVLRDMEHMSYEEIAQVTGLRLGTVKSRLHRARAALRDALERAQKPTGKPK